MEHSQILISVLIILVTLKITRLLRHRFFSLHLIPGPPSAHWFWGDFSQEGADLSNIHKKWVAEYGSTFKFHGVLNVGADRIVIELIVWLIFVSRRQHSSQQI